MKKIYVLEGFFMLVFSGSLLAQTVTFRTTDANVNTGDIFSVDMQVEDFDDITLAQFAIRWDPEVIEFLSLGEYNLEDLDAENFNTNGADTGMIKMSWYQESLEGITLTDGTKIYSLNFKAIGTSGKSSLVAVTDDPTTGFIIEAGNTGGAIEIAPENGTVCIGTCGTAATETHTSAFTLFQNHPNPFTETTRIFFSLKENADVQLDIHDAHGKPVYTQQGRFAAGENSIQLSRPLFQSAGIYFYTIKTEKATATRQLIVQ